MRHILTIILLLALCGSADAATYYVDFADGNDTAAGTATNTAWKHIPGTRNTGNTDWVTASYGGGTITTTNKVPAGTVFVIKRGTTHNAANGGLVQIDSSFYATDANAASPITIQVSTTWGTGATTLDAAGMTIPAFYGAVFVNGVNGLVMDGGATDNLVVQRSPENGITSYTGPCADTIYRNIKFRGNMTNYASASGVGVAALYLQDVSAVLIDNVTIDNADITTPTTHYKGNGVMLGNSHKYPSGTVQNSRAYNINGTFANSDGVGFKALNGNTVVFKNNIAYNNYKGFDCGEASGDGENIVYKFVNNTAYGNAYGININGPGGAYVGSVTFYMVNNLIYNNTVMGSNIYAGPYTLYLVHNTYSGNGTAAVDPDHGNIITTTNANDFTAVRVYSYNNIFYKPAGGTNLMQPYWYQDQSDYNIYADYNSYVQRASEPFMVWSYYVDGSPTYTYGANGPGHASGNWYAQYGGTTSAPSNGALGHYHNDANSKGTGAATADLPSFVDASSYNFVLSATYPGTDISGETWYIEEMGTDKAGVTRSVWDMGAYVHAETAAGTPTATSTEADKIVVSAGYTLDLNGNNTLRVEYKKATDSTYTTFGTLAHAESPFTTTITGLATATPYNVRITYVDPDGVTGTAAQVVNVTTVSDPIPPTAVSTSIGGGSRTAGMFGFGLSWAGRTSGTSPPYAIFPLTSGIGAARGSGGTFTRNSVQWYQPAGSTTWTSASANVAAFEGGGYLSEPAATNLCLQSQNAGTTWTQTNMDIGLDSIAAPDGTTTADTLTALADNATWVQTPTATTAVPKNWALWIKRKTGTGAVSMSLDGGSTYTAKTITTEWARYDITQTIAAHSLVLKLATSGDAVYVWQSDLTAASYPSSPIVTTTATVTRASTVLSYPISNLPTGNWSVRVSFTPKMAGTSSTAVRTLWSTYKSATEYISLNYNGVILYAEIGKGVGGKEYVTKPLSTTAGTTYNVVLKQDGGRFYLYSQQTKGADGLGNNLITGDFTSWTVGGAASLGSNTITTTDVGGAIKNNLTENLNAYVITDDYSTTAVAVELRNGTTGVAPVIKSAKGSAAFISTSANGLGLYYRHTGAGVTTFAAMPTLKKISNSTTASGSVAGILGTTFEVGSFNGTQQAQANFSNLTIYGNLGDAKAISPATP